MINRAGVASFLMSLIPLGCFNRTVPLHYPATGKSPEVIAVYEAWFGHPEHINIGYSSHDPAEIKSQMVHAKQMGISAFVVDWYGDREPFIDTSYGLMQKIAAKNKFKIAMMYDETDQDDGATDEAIADFTMFHDAYLSPKSPGRQAYLIYNGRPLIFIFPKGRHTDWSKVRSLVSTWNPAPLLIYENLPGPDAAAFDGFYAWISPGEKGWADDGSHWGDQYLGNFYQTMKSKYPDKMIIGGAWSQFNDVKASWGLNRHISARCGKTYSDTFSYWQKYFPPNDLIPFVMVETWNDYEEGSAIERGVPTCGPSQAE